MQEINTLNLEKTILSSLIFNYEEIYETIKILSKNDFFIKFHQDIYSVLIELSNENLPFDEDFIKSRFKKEDFNENLFIEILASNPITNTKAYALLLKEKSKIRKLENLSKEILLGIHHEKNSQDLLKSIGESLLNIETNEEKVTTINDLIKEIKIDMKKASENNFNILGQKSGLEALDNIIGAFEDGDLIIIAARPSMGKTSFISNLVIKMLEEGNGALVESLEMPSKKILARFLAAKSNENLSDIKRGLVKNPKNFNEAIEFFKTNNLIIQDKSYPTLYELTNNIKYILRRNPNIKNVFVDHTGKIKLEGKTREDIEIGHISAELKNIAKEFKVKVYLLQQLNRALESRENKRPMLSDLKNSGNIEEDADIVLGLYRESYYKEKPKTLIGQESPEDAEIIVLKNRDGKTGTAKVAFSGSTSKFIAKEITTIEFS